METYAADLLALVEKLDLKDAIHVGHSTGGGEVARYLGKYGTGRAGQGRPDQRGAADHGQDRRQPRRHAIEIFDGFRKTLLEDRAQFYLDLPTGPFYGYNRPGAKVSEGIIRKWWRQGMMGSVKAGYDCIKAFSETDFTEDLKKIDIPVIVMAGDDDQIVPYKGRGPEERRAAAQGHAEDLPGLPARDADDARGGDQRGPPGLLQELGRAVVTGRCGCRSPRWRLRPRRSKSGSDPGPRRRPHTGRRRRFPDANRRRGAPRRRAGLPRPPPGSPEG